MLQKVKPIDQPRAKNIKSIHFHSGVNLIINFVTFLDLLSFVLELASKEKRWCLKSTVALTYFIYCAANTLYLYWLMLQLFSTYGMDFIYWIQMIVKGCFKNAAKDRETLRSFYTSLLITSHSSCDSRLQPEHPYVVLATSCPVRSWVAVPHSSACDVHAPSHARHATLRAPHTSPTGDSTCLHSHFYPCVRSGVLHSAFTQGRQLLHWLGKLPHRFYKYDSAFLQR